MPGNATVSLSAASRSACLALLQMRRFDNNDYSTHRCVVEVADGWWHLRVETQVQAAFNGCTLAVFIGSAPANLARSQLLLEMFTGRNRLDIVRGPVGYSVQISAGRNFRRISERTWITVTMLEDNHAR